MPPQPPTGTPHAQAPRSFTTRLLRRLGIGRERSPAAPIALIGEIAGNAEALGAVLADIDRRGVRDVRCLGSVVGACASPDACIAMLRERSIPCVRGHLDALLDGDASQALRHVRAGLARAREILAAEDRDWLRGLPLTLRVETALAANGTLDAPESFGHVARAEDARPSCVALLAAGLRLGFVAHSHVPAAFFDGDPVSASRDETVPVDHIRATIVNVGSVGEPRDGDPRACYQLWDVARGVVSRVRVRYDVAAALRRIREAGLPEALFGRLGRGSVG